jgi:hypothetical protein
VKPGGQVKPHRSFDPRFVGQMECAVWVAYYRREWFAFLRSAVTLTHRTFGLPWPQTVYGSWLVLRANQLWAPYPDNDRVRARRAMERFYRIVQRRHDERFDPATAAWLEVEWWRVHREHQHSNGDVGEQPLIDALTKLYGYVYGAPEDEVRRAAAQRALAMRYSDRWVAEGCQLGSPLIDEVSAALVRSYAGLLTAVHQAELA